MTTISRTLRLDPGELRALLEGGQSEALGERFLDILDFFKENPIHVMSPQEQAFIESFVSHFLDLFADPRFHPSPLLIRRFITANHVIANLVAMTPLRTTDACLQRLSAGGATLPKILTLLNARCHADLDRNVLFARDPALASLWYFNYARAYYGVLQSQTGYENLRRHFAFTHPGLTLAGPWHESYFGSTYAGGDLDRQVKATVNRLVRAQAPPKPAAFLAPDPHRVAVVSAYWTHGHSVHRNYLEFIRSLKDRYHLSLFPPQLGDEIDTSHFDEVIPYLEDGVLHADRIMGGGFKVVIFPDVGMISHLIPLANLRMAPIQVAMLGHSVSTFGAEIDYFFSGAAVETPDHPERHYSERLVLLPNMGIVHEPPRYQRHGLKPPWRAGDPVIVNSLSTCQKLNYPYIQALARIVEHARQPVRFRFFLGSSSNRANDHIPFTRDVAAALGPHRVEFFGSMEYAVYMAEVEHGDLSVDSHPFGGCNTVSDSLYAHVPMVTWEGERWYGRIGAEMLRRAGLGGCVATSEEEFVALTTRMINDDAHREVVRARLRAANLDATIYDRAEARYFRRAFDYLVDRHAELQLHADRAPIRIAAD